MDKEQLEYVSPYSAGASSSDDMTTGQYEYYLTQATIIFTSIDTGVSLSTASYCKSLLVAHLYECSQGRTGFSSEGIGDYSYSRIPGILTSFKQQVMDVLLGAATSSYQTTIGMRCDENLLGEFALDAEDQRKYPTV